MAFRKPIRSNTGEREYFKLQNYRGELVVFKVNDEDEDYLNPRFASDDPRPTVWADATIITGEDAGKMFPNAEIGGRYVYNALADYVGTDEEVLGRVIQGNIGGKPYFINEPDDDDERYAKRFLDKNPPIPVTAASADDEDDDDDVPY